MNRVAMRSIITVAFICFGLYAYAQNKSDHAFNIEDHYFSYYDSFNEKQYDIKEYILNNNSNEDYYTWIDYDRDYAGVDTQGIMYYFLSFHGDFNLISLLTDNVVFYDYMSILGKVFLRRIEPGDSFRYVLINRDNDDIRRHIFYISQTQLGFEIINQEPLYDESFIVL